MINDQSAQRTDTHQIHARTHADYTMYIGTGDLQCQHRGITYSE